MSPTQVSRRPSPEPPEALVLLYHYVREPSEGPVITEPALDPATFERQLDAVERTRRIVGWPEFERRLAGSGDHDPICLLTFDDGLRDHHRTVLPVLARRGVPGVFFVLAREPSDGLALGHRIHVLLGLLEPGSLAEAILDRASHRTDARSSASTVRRSTQSSHSWSRPWPPRVIPAATRSAWSCGRR
ncbi:MAG TPA: polysaccharide deacetylase family protein [Candidatus Limnocylindrales bacterium]|nr:polysaccharide deacetylase family protein [Candidatus Limnocylindrales bacterium]